MKGMTVSYYYGPPMRGSQNSSSYSVWILLLLLGLVVGSPLPELEDQPVSIVSHGVEVGETKTIPQSHTIPFAPREVEERESSIAEVEDLEPVSITSPTMFHRGIQETKQQFNQQENQNGNDEHSDNSKMSQSSSYREVHITSEIRSVAFQINKKSEDDTLIPPLVFSQKAPEINLEPTEVEAPGTTPTTVSMITEVSTSLSSLTDRNDPISYNDKSSSTEANEDVILTPDNRVVIIESKDIKRDPYVNYTESSSFLKPRIILRIKKPIKHREHLFDNLPQHDDPRTLMIDSYPTLGDMVSTITKGSNKNKGQHNNHPTAFIKSHDSVQIQDELEKNDKMIPINDDLIVPIISGNQKIASNNNTKRVSMVTSDSITDNNASINNEDPFLLESRTEPKNTNSDKELHLGTATTVIPDSDLSVIETREADEDSFFRTLDTPEEPRGSKISTENKKVNEDSELVMNKSGYVSAVFTSSSEIDYRNYNPELKASNQAQIDKTTYSSNNSSATHANKTQRTSDDRPIEQPNSSRVKIIFNDKAFDERNEEHFFATSLPSQTYIVKPLEEKMSGSMRRETATSGRITKSPHDANSHTMPKLLHPASLEPISLEVYPKNSSLSPPVKKKRISVTISQHVEEQFPAGSIVAIVLGIVLSLAIAVGGITYYYYNRQTGIRPKVLSSDRSCSNSDSGGYLDDQCRVAYVNSQVDITKGTPEDLVSLDNDSFLNSLESMTIQNLWTDSIRHTKL